jgi:hypothetical protein
MFYLLQTIIVTSKVALSFQMRGIIFTLWLIYNLIFLLFNYL